MRKCTKERLIGQFFWWVSLSCKEKDVVGCITQLSEKKYQAVFSRHKNHGIFDNITDAENYIDLKTIERICSNCRNMGKESCVKLTKKIQ